MRREVLSENVPRLLSGSVSEINALELLIKHCEESKQDEATLDLIRVSPTTVQLRIDNYVGMLCVGDLEIFINPKIGLPHFTEILSYADPKLKQAIGRYQDDADGTIVETLIVAFCSEIKRLLTGGLYPDYETVPAIGTRAAGKILLLETLTNFWRGSLLIHSETDQLSYNTALNRVLKGALTEISKARFGERLGLLARPLLLSFEEVDAYLKADLFTADIDVNTFAFSDALQMARFILINALVNSMAGPIHNSSFFIYTPDIVERGLRAHINEHVAHGRAVKRRASLGTSSLFVEPDLLFKLDIESVGDIKYKIGLNANRSDLFQIISYATNAGCRDAAVFNFSPISALRPHFTVGNLRISVVSWPLDVSPSVASRHFQVATRQWLRTVNQDQILASE